MMATMLVYSLNCRGLAEDHKRRQIFNFFQQTAADIILLQETHTSIKSSRKYDREWKNPKRAVSLQLLQDIQIFLDHIHRTCLLKAQGY